jgi:hypothetical protein
MMAKFMLRLEMLMRIYILKYIYIQLHIPCLEQSSRQA